LVFDIIKNDTPPCRVQRSFEPAFAGWVPPQMISLGRSLSRHICKIGTFLMSVGPKPERSITNTAGYYSYTIKISLWVDALD